MVWEEKILQGGAGFFLRWGNVNGMYCTLFFSWRGRLLLAECRIFLRGGVSKGSVHSGSWHGYCRGRGALLHWRKFDFSLYFLVSVPGTGTLHNVWQATSPTSCSCLIYRYITVHFWVYVVLGQSNLLPSLALLERWKQCGSSSTTILSKKKNNFNKRRPIPTLTSKVGWKVF